MRDTSSSYEPGSESDSQITATYRRQPRKRARQPSTRSTRSGTARTTSAYSHGGSSCGARGETPEHDTENQPDPPSTAGLHRQPRERARHSPAQSTTSSTACTTPPRGRYGGAHSTDGDTPSGDGADGADGMSDATRRQHAAGWPDVDRASSPALPSTDDIKGMVLDDIYQTRSVARHDPKVTTIASHGARLSSHLPSPAHSFTPLRDTGMLASTLRPLPGRHRSTSYLPGSLGPDDAEGHPGQGINGTGSFGSQYPVEADRRSRCTVDIELAPGHRRRGEAFPASTPARPPMPRYEPRDVIDLTWGMPLGDYPRVGNAVANLSSSYRPATHMPIARGTGSAVLDHAPGGHKRAGRLEEPLYAGNRDVTTGPARPRSDDYRKGVRDATLNNMVSELHHGVKTRFVDRGVLRCSARAAHDISHDHFRKMVSEMYQKGWVAGPDGSMNELPRTAAIAPSMRRQRPWPRDCIEKPGLPVVLVLVTGDNVVERIWAVYARLMLECI